MGFQWLVSDRFWINSIRVKVERNSTFGLWSGGERIGIFRGPFLERGGCCTGILSKDFDLGRAIHQNLIIFNGTLIRMF